jgi:hypothetical protein
VFTADRPRVRTVLGPGDHQESVPVADPAAAAGLLERALAEDGPLLSADAVEDPVLRRALAGRGVGDAIVPRCAAPRGRSARCWWPTASATSVPSAPTT